MLRHRRRRPDDSHAEIRSGAAGEVTLRTPDATLMGFFPDSAGNTQEDGAGEVSAKRTEREKTVIRLKTLTSSTPLSAVVSPTADWNCARPARSVRTDSCGPHGWGEPRRRRSGDGGRNGCRRASSAGGHQAATDGRAETADLAPRALGAPWTARSIPGHGWLLGHSPVDLVQSPQTSGPAPPGPDSGDHSRDSDGGAPPRFFTSGP